MSISAFLNLLGFGLMVVSLVLSLTSNHRPAWKISLIAAAFFIAAICMIGKEWP